MAQSLLGVMDNLYAACKTIYATSKAPDGTEVLVSYGAPGNYLPNAIVAVMDAAPSQPVSRPTIGANRSRDMQAEIAVMFSVYVPGGNEAHQSALNCVLTLLRALETYFQTSPNEHLNGACRDAWVSSIAGPAGSVTKDQQDNATGRVVEATAYVTALIRY